MAILGPQDILFLGLCIVAHLIYRSHRKALLPYPPGPPRWPLIGSAFYIPTTGVYKYYKELGQRLGSKIIYLEALNQPIVVLNDAQIARDLLEKRLGLYSSRPRVAMLADVMQYDILFTIMLYGDEWRNHRRLFQQYFSPKNLQREQEIELDVVRKGLLPNLYQSPHDVDEQLRSCVGGISTIMTYGLRIHRKDDPVVELGEAGFTATSEIVVPGKYLVEMLPMLKYVPEWMPGANFKRLANQTRDLLKRVTEETYRATLKNMEDGTARESFVSSSVEWHKNKPDFELQARHIKQAASQIHGAVSEMTVAAAMTFVLAMVKYPDIQQKAQQEIDSVIGHDRLPDFSDMPLLLYLSAIIKEVLRWNPIVPLGFPHFMTHEDTYNRYYIPKGSVIIANAYAMLHDEDVFPDPLEFKPERFFKDGKIRTDIPDPELYATFGFGRRMCPRAHIGLSTFYIIAASILSVFEILPELDDKGNPIEVTLEFATDMIISRLKSFKHQVVPRKEKNVEVLLKEYLNFEYI